MAASARLRGYLALLHPFPVAMTVLAAGLFAVVAARGTPPLGRLAWLLASVLASQIAIASLNDYCDRQLDAATKPWKPIPAGRVSARVALAVAMSAAPIALLCALPLGAVALAAAVVGTAGGVAYDLRFKGTVWSVVPFVIAFPTLPIWAWAAVAPFEPRLLESYLLGAPLVTGLHLADTWPDLEADRAQGVRGLAHRLGPHRARRLLWAAFAAAALVLLALTALPGHASGVLVGAAVLSAVLVGAALALSRGGVALARWPLAFPLLVGAAIVTSLGWLASLVV